jgi:hypothetical protein|tara:strand:+ start:7290 stop:7727 length:438 start_codon:yes stop_codon:yes gene_type:complete
MEARPNRGIIPMQWIVMKEAFGKIWLWLKTYWQVPLALIWSVVVYLFAKRNSDALVDVLAAKKDSYDKQIKELKKRHNNEIIERDKLIADYHEAVIMIEEKFKEKEKKLSTKEKKRIKEIVKKSKGEPDVIRAEIEKSFGFTFID